MNGLSEWGVPLAVGGLLLSTLILASIVKRYQTHQATIQARLRQVERGLRQIESALETLATIPLSKELRMTLRSDVLARYQKIRQLYRKYPQLSERLLEAETALKSVNDPVGQDVGAIESEQLFRTITAAIDELSGLFRAGGTLQPVPADVRGIFCRELGERRAEVLSRFHLVAANRFHSEGDSVKARAHVTTLMQLLRQRGPSTEFVRALYEEAEHALSQISKGRPLGEKEEDEGETLNEATG